MVESPASLRSALSWIPLFIKIKAIKVPCLSPFLFSQILNVSKFAEPDFRKFFRLPSIIPSVLLCPQNNGTVKEKKPSGIHVLSTWGFFPPWLDHVLENLQMLLFPCNWPLWIISRYLWHMLTYISAKQSNFFFKCPISRQQEAENETPFLLTNLPKFWVCC